VKIESGEVLILNVLASEGELLIIITPFTEKRGLKRGGTSKEMKKRE